jgi:hypothetical protein
MTTKIPTAQFILFHKINVTGLVMTPIQTAKETSFLWHFITELIIGINIGFACSKKGKQINQNSFLKA